MKNKCPFCQKKTWLMSGLFWHYVTKHLFTGKTDEEPDQEPLPPLPP
jgi:hypothetical protein